MLRGIVAALLICTLAGVAYADNKDAAKEAYSEGKRQYDLGDYDAALTAFKKAYLNYEEPVFLFNIAQCYRALGDKPAAVRSYRAFLRNWPKAPNREQVERIVAELETAIAQEPGAKPAPPTAAKPAQAQETPPPKPSEPGKPAATHAEAQPKPPAATGSTAPPPAEAAPKPGAEPKPASASKATAPAKHEELVGMVEVEPNFDRPSGSPTHVRWWAWTLIALGVGGLVAAAVAIGVTQSAPKFETTLPTFNVNNSALHALTVRF